MNRLAIHSACGRGHGEGRSGSAPTKRAALSATLRRRANEEHRYTLTEDERIELALRRSRHSFPAGTPDSKILAALVSRGEQALEQEREAKEGYERRRRAAAKRLASRFRRAEGLDYAALGEASANWLGE